ncbi:septum formation family protein [Nocardioides sp. HM23]|uniref:DUF4190 domain-containing protein n=1 Tax=Nocardioides bizhenqiangii TaxID=3095076 RepID=UPI002ACA0A7E|nr:septum formation family protein [Nocardioides sp. HM23]MDZ5622915.1 septum formation family protein [Nocardioides sp. HM23]
MPEIPPGDLTPPGPPPDPEPGTAGRPAGARSVDEWIAENRGRTQTSDPYASPGQLRLGEAPRYAADKSRKMAGWALGLAIAFCIPFAFLVAIGLAIAVLVRSRGGGDHGKGMAIAALIISGLLIVLNVVYVVVVLFNGIDNTERDSEGRVVDGGTVTLDRLRIGDCFDEPNLDDIPTDGSEAEGSASVEVVPCGEPHQAEFFHSIEVGGDDFPGTAALDRRGAECLRAFEEYVGKPFRRSSLEVVYYSPTPMSWRLGDHTILCTVTEPDMSDVTGSVKNSRR